MASHPRFWPDMTQENVQNFRHLVMLEKENLKPTRVYKKKPAESKDNVKQEQIVKFDEWHL